MILVVKCRFLVLIAALMAFGTFFVGSASADATPAQLSNESVSYSALTLQEQQTVWINATEHGALEIKAQQPKLQRKLKQRLNEHKEHGLECREGEAVWGASQTSSGQTVVTPRPGNHGRVHACLIDGVWRQVLGKHQWNCGNQIWWMNEAPPKGVVKYTGKVVIVTKFTFSAQVTAQAVVSATLSAMATCDTAGSHAGGSGTVTGNGSVYVSFSVSGKSQAQVKAAGSAGLQKVATQQSGSLQGSAKVDAELKLSAAAWAQCSSSTPPPSQPVCTDTSALNYGSSLPCEYPPPLIQSIVITSMTTLNDIPTGKSSGPFYINVNASEAGGSLTIDPGIGAVSSCESTTPEGSITFSSLPAGNAVACIILYAPSDPAQPTSMTITATATLGNAFDMESETFGITYPTRPS